MIYKKEPMIPFGFSQTAKTKKILDLSMLSVYSVVESDPVNPVHPVKKTICGYLRNT